MFDTPDLKLLQMHSSHFPILSMLSGKLLVLSLQTPLHSPIVPYQADQKDSSPTSPMMRSVLQGLLVGFLSVGEVAS